MTSPDELAEMKLWTPCLHDMWRATETDPQLIDASKLYYARDEVDRVIAARDARIAELQLAFDERVRVIALQLDDKEKLKEDRDEADRFATEARRLSKINVDFGCKMRDERDEARKALASRDAEIAEAREIMERACPWFQIQEVAHPKLGHKARAIWLSMQRWLTPPSQAPEARRGGGGENRNERCPHGVAILNRCECCD